MINCIELYNDFTEDKIVKARKINILGRDNASVNVVIDGLLGVHQLAGITPEDVMDRLAILDEGRYEGIKS